MSLFSGKCDVYDSIVMISCDSDIDKVNEYLKTCDIYICTSDGKRHKLDIKTYRDLIPYFPYLIAIAVASATSATIVLSNKSFIDSEEEEMLKFRYDDCIKYYKKCKRNKTKFDIEEYLHKSWSIDDISREIAVRISIDGLKATTSGIHRPMQNYYRKKLAEEMEVYGYTDTEIINHVFPDKKFTNFNWREL